MHFNLVPPCPPNLPIATNIQSTDYPFMNNMDAISYWIYTKRAPCLFNYDNIVKKQVEQAHCSNVKPASIRSKNEDESPPKPQPKKKKKLKLLDEESVSTEKQQNIFFKPPQNQKITVSICKTDVIESVIDFDINNSPVQKKRKRKLQGSCQKIVHKKNKVVTSTPKVVHLRRSPRKAQQNFNNNNKHLDSSFDIFNSRVINGKQEKQLEELNRNETVANNDRDKSKVILPEKAKNELVVNGQFEELSDVSGFTANYIRSTKMHSSKIPRKLRNRNSRTLIKNAKQTVQDGKMIMCVNKSVNTGFPDAAALNCSTDSSQNALNLVTVSNERSTRVNKGTSMLKFMGTKLEDSNTSNKINEQESKNNLNVSFQSRSSGASRYPKRHRNNTVETPEQNCSTNNVTGNSFSRKRNTHKGKLSTNRKENSEDNIVSKTRSGRRIGVNLEESGCSMLQLNNSTEQAISNAAVNVACANEKLSKKNNYTLRCLRSRTCRNKSAQLCKDSASDGSNKKNPDAVTYALEQTTLKCVRQVKKSMDKAGTSFSRDSLRDKSGFAACFSDSDSDSEPLKQRKFFC